MSTKAPFLVLPVLVLCLPQLCDGESAPGARIVRARADVFAAADVVNGGVLKSVGVIDFTTVDTQDKVLVNGTITGLSPENHGFHIHEFGDYGNNCLATGDHFNPRGATHGGRESPQRHVGDLGNVVADADGTAHFSFEDSLISLNGPESIIGRAVVVHANPDPGTTANSGPRVACGVIGIVA
ncbi:superoxide dismutase [Aphelenchoides avenae]|nr:superoxide dismutase [Aphelenchus avenae]